MGTEGSEVVAREERREEKTGDGDMRAVEGDE